MKVLLVDGPAPWAGQTVDTAGLGDSLERTLPGTEDEYVLGVWERTDMTVEVEVTRRRRNDAVVEKKVARVYRYAGERRVSKHPARRDEPSEQMSLI